MTRNTIVYDSDLNPVIEKASNDELQWLVDLITNTYTSTLENNGVYEANYPNHTVYADLIAKEICEFGGNTFMNFFRKRGPAYREVVSDVAEKLDASFPSDASVEVIENSIILCILQKYLYSMSYEDKKKLLTELDIDGKENASSDMEVTAMIIGCLGSGGVNLLKITAVIFQYLSEITGNKVDIFSKFGLKKIVVGLISPISQVVGWGIDMAGPAYRVTIPAVVYVSLLRQKQMLN